jgi:hypothetical protein
MADIALLQIRQPILLSELVDTYNGPVLTPQYLLIATHRMIHSPAARMSHLVKWCGMPQGVYHMRLKSFLKP